MKTDLKKLRADAAEAQSKANYRKALGLYEEICERDPTDALAHHRAGELFGRLGRPGDAVRRLRAGADLYARQGFLLKSIAVCKMILQMEPDHQEAQAQLVDLYARKADHESKAPATASPIAPPSAAPSTMPSRGVVESPSSIGTIEAIALSESGMWSGGHWGGAAEGADSRGQTSMHLMGSVLDSDGLSTSDKAGVSQPLRPTGPIIAPSRRPSSTAPIDMARGAPPSAEPNDLTAPNANELLDLGIELPPLPLPTARAAAPSGSPPPPTGPRAPSRPIGPGRGQEDPIAAATSSGARRRSANEIRGATPRAPSRGPGTAEPAPPAPPVTPLGQAPVAASIYSRELHATPAPHAIAPSPPRPEVPPPAPRMAGLPPPASPAPWVSRGSPGAPIGPERGQKRPMSSGLAPAIPGDVSGVVRPVLPKPLLPGPVLPGPNSIVRPAAPRFDPMPPPPPVRPSLGDHTSVSPTGHSARFHVAPITIKPEGSAADPLEAVEISIDEEPALVISTRSPGREIPRTPLFEGLDPAALRSLIDRLEYERFEAGQVITREGEIGDALYVIAEGEVRVETGTPPREVGRLRDGDFFGEIAIISNFPRTATVIADRSTEVLRLTRAVIWPLIEEYPDFLARLVKFVRDRLVNTLTKTSPLFLALPPTDRTALAAQFKLLEVEEGRELVTEGRRSEGLFVMLGGRCELSVPAADGTRSTMQLGPGSIVGEISLLTRAPAAATVRTLNRSWVLWMSPQTFSEMLMTYPTVLEYVHHLAEQRQQQAASLRMP